MRVNCRFRCEEERKQRKIRILVVYQIESHAQNAPIAAGVHLSFADGNVSWFCSFVLRDLYPAHKVSCGTIGEFSSKQLLHDPTK